MYPGRHYFCAKKLSVHEPSNATAILFSADPKYVMMNDVINHLRTHQELFWEVGFPVDKNNFHFPLSGFIYIKGQNVRYKIIRRDILPFLREHYENKSLAEKVKPETWQKLWEEQRLQKKWKTVFVITKIDRCNYGVTEFVKINDKKVTRANQSYTRVQVPDED